VVAVDLSTSQRWELYRVLSEPIRLRLLALAADDELSMGELVELLGEGQPNVSRHAAALRQAGLLRFRREGTRTFVRLATEAARDPVVTDALSSGRALCERDGSVARIAQILRAREAAAHEFFARPGKSKVDGPPAEMGAYLGALGLLLPKRALAVDAGTGDGRLLDVLAPIYERVVAVDRSAAQLVQARERVSARGFANVSFMQAELDANDLRRAVGEGADAVFASRVLHHAPRPASVVAQLVTLCAPGGAVVVIDYVRHEDESMREQADVWLGFEPAELHRFARAAGLEDVQVLATPSALCGDGPDRHLPWQALFARNPSGSANGHRRRKRNYHG
jgi:DNA-binding transcriptional ArsR family regulator